MCTLCSGEEHITSHTEPQNLLGSCYCSFLVLLHTSTVHTANLVNTIYPQLGSVWLTERIFLDILYFSSQYSYILVCVHSIQTFIYVHICSHFWKIIFLVLWQIYIAWWQLLHSSENYISFSFFYLQMDPSFPVVF